MSRYFCQRTFFIPTSLTKGSSTPSTLTIKLPLPGLSLLITTVALDPTVYDLSHRYISQTSHIAFTFNSNICMDYVISAIS